MRVFISKENSTTTLYLYIPKLSGPKYERIKGERKPSPVVVVFHTVSLSLAGWADHRNKVYAVLPTAVIVACRTR